MVKSIPCFGVCSSFTLSQCRPPIFQMFCSKKSVFYYRKLTGGCFLCTWLVHNQIYYWLFSLSILSISSCRLAALVGVHLTLWSWPTFYNMHSKREKLGDFYCSRERKRVWSKLFGVVAPSFPPFPQVWKSCNEVIMESQWEGPLVFTLSFKNLTLKSHFCWYSHRVANF